MVIAVFFHCLTMCLPQVSDVDDLLIQAKKTRDRVWKGSEDADKDSQFYYLQKFHFTRGVYQPELLTLFFNDVTDQNGAIPERWKLYLEGRYKNKSYLLGGGISFVAENVLNFVYGSKIDAPAGYLTTKFQFGAKDQKFAAYVNQQVLVMRLENEQSLLGSPLRILQIDQMSGESMWELRIPFLVGGASVAGRREDSGTIDIRSHGNRVVIWFCTTLDQGFVSIDQATGRIIHFWTSGLGSDVQKR